MSDGPASPQPAVRSVVRSGAYHDSIVLMRLQRALAELPGVIDAGVVMATPANLELLAASGLLQGGAPPAAGPHDLLISVKAESEEEAAGALARIDALVAPPRAGGEGGEYRPRSLGTAVRQLPEARWVLVSVPGRYAAAVANEALDLGRNVFLYSDNVPMAEEVALKRQARERGLLVMGPDCGTAVVGGVGLGFANRVRRGPVGLVGASGTGLQAVMAHLHAAGSGVSQALGTGGRDLAAGVGGIAAAQALDLLRRDPDTQVIALISKPPAPEVAARLLALARTAGKPVVVYFLGAPPPDPSGNLHFAGSLDEAAEMAIGLLAERPGEEDRDRTGVPPAEDGRGLLPGTGARGEDSWAVGARLHSASRRIGGGLPPALPALAESSLGRSPRPSSAPHPADRAVEGGPGEEGPPGNAQPAVILQAAQPEPEARFLRGLFSGGTLAAEALLGLAAAFAPVHSNLSAGAAPPERDSSSRSPTPPLPDRARSQGHTILDLGADEFTVGRLHPMIDFDLRLRRLRQEAADPEVALILLDVVLGEGAHPDPAGELAPAVERAREEAHAAGRELAVVAVVVIGTDEDPQGLAGQVETLESAGARVFFTVRELVEHAVQCLPAGQPMEWPLPEPPAGGPGLLELPEAPERSMPPGLPVPLAVLEDPLAAVNVGLESFYDSLRAQGAPAIQVDWRPPAGGDEKLAGILARLKGR